MKISRTYLEKLVAEVLDDMADEDEEEVAEVTTTADVVGFAGPLFTSGGTDSGKTMNKRTMKPRMTRRTLIFSSFVSASAVTMHKLSTAVPQSSTLTALCFLGLLGVLHEYACGALPRTPCHRGPYGTSSRKPIHNPG